MTEHTEMTAGQIDELRISTYRGAPGLGYEHRMSGQIFEQLCAQAKANVGAGGAATVTEEMVAAYLKANDAYWKEADAQPQKMGKWRNGTPSEATRHSLIAALAATPSTAQAAMPEEPFGKNGMAEPRSTAAEIRSGMHNKNSEYIATMLECMADCIEEYRAHCLALRKGCDGTTSTAALSEGLDTGEARPSRPSPPAKGKDSRVLL